MSNEKTPTTIRCAIYTRKSTEEGLEQEFNSLDAQRESAENYIASQKGQGWECLSDHYDDGGFTGGNMERPALGRMLADIDTGKIDCVVVYKVDRLSRSLMDFAKILERFESKNVSFVSVTQQFNTTTSMGRLTLNILLSFAQFEREVISERTRDKIAMARKRGKYTGGRPVLGYNVSSEVGKLIVNETEAQQVKAIFELYLKRGSLLPVVDELNRLGWHTKEWVTRKGTTHKGHPYDKNRVHALLKNPIYTGKMQYEGVLYEGEHEAIVGEEIFEQVQRKLTANRNVPTHAKPNKYGGILKGILRCKACDSGMSHSYSKKKTAKKSYRYYVCQNAISRGWANCPHPSLPAHEIEQFVISEIRAIGLDENMIDEIVSHSRESIEDEIHEHKKRLKLLQKELAGYNAQLKPMLSMPQPDEPQIASIREKIAITERDISTVTTRLEGLRSGTLTAEDIRTACRKFNPLWDTLSNHEQWRMLSLLLERVEFDAETETINITFAPGGIKTLNYQTADSGLEEVRV